MLESNNSTASFRIKPFIFILELFTELREVLRIESESVPLSEGLECNSESNVFEMMFDLERFITKLSEQL